MIRRLLSRHGIGVGYMTLLAAILIISVSLGLGYRLGPGAQVPAADPAQGAVADKVWVSADEIRNRFPLAKHEEFLRRAVGNARMAGIVKRTGGPFGAVIVSREGQIVGEGSNHVVAKLDPTCHAEMEAIREACSRRKSLSLDECILYTSSEPCPMCLAAAYWARLDGSGLRCLRPRLQAIRRLRRPLPVRRVVQASRSPEAPGDPAPPRRGPECVEGVRVTPGQRIPLT